MSKMRFGTCYGSGGDGDYDKNKAQGLYWLGDVDIAGNLHLRSDTDNSRGDKQQD